MTDAGAIAADLLVVMGTAVTVEATSPLASCISDQRSARVNLLGPDNLPRARAPTLALHPSVGGQLEAAVTFTPDEEGAWTVEVAFEPSLGTSRHQVWVATPRAASGALPLARFTVPTTCVDAPWPVSESRIACELESGDIVLVDSDGGTSRFPGAQLAVVDTSTPVLWAVNEGALEQRDGEGVLTRRFDDGTILPIAGEHDQTSAIRRVDTSTVAAFESGFDGGHVNPVNASRFSSQAFHLEGAQIVTDEGLLGLEPGLLWQMTGDVVVGVPRPVPDAGIAIWSIRRRPHRVGFQARPFTTLPLQFVVDDQRVVITPDERRLSVDAWPAEPLWKIGRQFVLLHDGPGKAALYRR